MSVLTKLDPKTVARRLKNQEIVLIDIREADEFAREHIAHAISLPMSNIETADIKIGPEQHVVFHCKSGMRTNSNCERLAQQIDGDAYVLEGGLEAWKAQGLPVDSDNAAPLEIMRQVQIAAGTLVLVGVLLGLFAHPGFFGLAAFVGGGLMFAGISGWCGMAKLLSAMPWNQREAA